MYATGQYYAIDTFSGYMKEGNYNETKDSRQKDKERFVGAELVNDNIVAIKERTIGVVRNFLGGQW